MGGMFTISVECSFSASHRLSGCPPCDRIHGHTWRVRAYWAFSELDRTGMAVDFGRLKEVLDGKIKLRFDHRHLNDISLFEGNAPTAENLAREIFRLLAKERDSFSEGKLERVEVWEGLENFVAYEED